MGCLKNIIKIIIIFLAIVGLKVIVNHIPFLEGKIHIFEKPTQEQLQKKASDVADFSKINKEYQITKTANVLGIKAVIVEHKGSGQKIIVANEGKKNFLTKKDFATKTIDQKIMTIAEKMQYQFIRFEDIKITQRGTFTSMGQTVPFVKFTADTVNLPFPDVAGIIGVANDKTNKNHILMISVNEGKKYSQIISQEFFKDVQ